MKSMNIKIEVVGNTVLFSNSYIDESLRGHLRYTEKKYPIKINSCSNPQLSVEFNESNKIHQVKVFLQGEEKRHDDIVSDAILLSDTMVSEVVGWILMSCAKCDMLTKSQREETESTLIINGTVIKMDTGKQLDIARYLLGGAV
jgi:hypothetical protein